MSLWHHFSRIQHSEVKSVRFEPEWWRIVKSKTYTQSKRPLDKNERSEFCQSSVKQTHFQNLKKKRKLFFWSQGHFNIIYSIDFSEAMQKAIHRYTKETTAVLLRSTFLSTVYNIHCTCMSFCSLSHSFIHLFIYFYFLFTLIIIGRNSINSEKNLSSRCDLNPWPSVI